MEGTITKISYNEGDDILFIYKKGKVKGNIMIGGFVFDISYRSEIIGIEVLDATRNLEMFGITKEMLKNAKTARLITKRYPEGIIFAGFELLSFIKNKIELNEPHPAVVAMPEIINKI